MRLRFTTRSVSLPPEETAVARLRFDRAEERVLPAAAGAGDPYRAQAGGQVAKTALLSIMAFPRHGDSYTECFYRALEAEGVRVVEGIFAGRWLLAELHGFDYVHLHWPSFFYSLPSRAAALRAYLLFLFFLALARWRGARVIWTAHNLYPHDHCVIPQLDRWTRLLLARIATRVIVHGPTAAGIVRREFPASARRILVLEQGNWLGYYPDEIGRAAARLRLGLPAAGKVLLFIGLCKPYKNLEGLVTAFDRLGAPATLVIAGKFQQPAYEASVKAAVAASTADIRLYPGYVADDALQLFLRASDLVVLPYTEVLTSGSAMLALSFGRPVITPALGALRDLITVDCGILYDPTLPDGLLAALRAGLRTSFDEAPILARARQQEWSSSARRLVESLP